MGRVYPFSIEARFPSRENFTAHASTPAMLRILTRSAFRRGADDVRVICRDSFGQVISERVHADMDGFQRYALPKHAAADGDSNG